MDRTLERLVDYALGFSEADLAGPVREAALNRLVDTIAVAIAGQDAEPGRIAIELARGTHSDTPATIVGAGLTTTPDLAAFANTIMIRTYDWNDGMKADGGGHPSDMIPGVLAIGEVAHCSGRDALIAVTLAYELLGGMGAAVEKGSFDQGLFMAPAVALSAGRLLGLSREQLANAASLALTPNLPLGASRWGALSMMKGAATAFAIRSGVFAVQLSGRGFTAAEQPFEGYYGLWQVLGEFQPRLPVLPDGPRVVQMAHQKPVPADTQGLAVLDVAPRLRAWAPVDDIAAIDIDAPERVARHVADPAKYDPQTRETADHSLPFLLAAYLVDGQISLASYTDERVLDPALRPVMAKIRVHADDAYTEIHKTQVTGVARPTPRRVRARTHDGREFSEEVMWHRGSFQNPLTRADIDAKLDLICEGAGIDDGRREAIREAWWGVEDAGDI